MGSLAIGDDIPGSSDRGETDTQETVFDEDESQVQPQSQSQGPIDSQSQSQSQSLLANATDSELFNFGSQSLANGQSQSEDFDSMDLDLDRQEHGQELVPQFPETPTPLLFPEEPDSEIQIEIPPILEEDEEPDADAEEDDEEETTQNDAKLYRLPLSKIKRIIRTDADIQKVSQESLVLVSIAAEHFVSLLAQQSYRIAVAGKKKTIVLNHVKSVLESSGGFEFLEGCIPEHGI